MATDHPSEAANTEGDYRHLVVRHAADLDWEGDADSLALGEGVQVKVLREDRESGAMDLLIKFPHGYVEPQHTHAADHAVIILEGTQEAGDAVLGPGDYLYGPADLPHGPFRYPTGCILFASMRGGDATHRTEGDTDVEQGRAG